MKTQTLKKAMNTALCAFALLAYPSARAAETFLIECEDFQFLSGWTTMHLGREWGLFSLTDDATPLTVFETKEGGAYSIWTSAADNAETAQGTRLYSVIVDGTTMPEAAGKHGHNGLYWEKVGEANLAAGAHTIAIKRLTQYVRADAVLVTNDPSYDPNKALKNSAERKKITVAPVEVPYETLSSYASPSPLKEIKNPKKFGIQNRDIRILYTEMKDASGTSYYVRSAELPKDGKWVKLPDFKDEYLLLLSARDPKFKDSSYFVAWSGTQAKIRVDFKGNELILPASPSNPYAVENAEVMRPKKVEKVSERALKLDYGNGISALISLGESGPCARMEVKAQIQDDAYYSLAFVGFNPLDKEAVDATLLPAIYQGKRLMNEPKMVGTNMTSQPLSALQTTHGDMKITNALIADPKLLPFEWSRPGSAVMGFSISNNDGKPQAAVFYPILGGRNSKKAAGEPLEASWNIASFAGDWTQVLTYANENIFEGSTFRESYDVSFSDAVANIAEYLKNERFSGWSRTHKGRWNIEDKSLVTHAVPLSEIEVALLTNDEEYYKNIALPTIEFTLSRNVHFSIYPAGNAYSQDPAVLRYASKGMDYYAGLDALLGKKNTWLKELYLDQNGNPRFRNAPDAWNEMLGYYFTNPSAELLEKIKAQCDAWLVRAFDKMNDKEVNLSAFVNVSHYPYWWYLPDMYEATKDKKYLDYARQGAFYTLSTLWNFPTPPKGEITINKDNLVTSPGYIWWYGENRVRMGSEEDLFVFNLPRKSEKDSHLRYSSNAIQLEKKIPDAMKVSRIGVGIEQYSTYLSLSHNYSNIVMPSWSGEMLRTFRHSGDDILMKYSRHAIIGRYSNFIGYYVLDFTDIMHASDYPYTGPDITSFYYHHAPCHFEQSYDYLMAQFEIAAGGNIDFPFVRQQGYVWFTDRVYGRTGKFFTDENCRLMLDKRAAIADTAKASVVLARAPEAVWVGLLNDSEAEREIEIEFDPTSRAMEGVDVNAEVLAYSGDGKAMNEKFGFFGKKKVKLGSQKMAAFRIPATADVRPSAELPALPAGSHILKKAIGGNWGDLHIFRIRGPFGKDSVYAFVTGGVEKKDAKIRMSLNGKQTITKASFPYEISVYPLSPEEDFTVQISLFENGAENAKTETLTLKAK